MPDSPHLLAIDNGTQSVRALLFDLDGNLVTKARIPIEAYFSEHPGWAEQHPEVFWAAVCRACNQLWDETTVSPAAVTGVALTTQRGTVINLDRDGHPLRPAMSWLDQREAKDLPPMGGPWGLLFRALGESGTLDYFRRQAEANWIRRNQPDIWRRTHKYLLLSGYLTWRLTDRYVDSIACQVGYIPFDFRRFGWAGPRDWKWRALPVERRMLPELVPPGGRLGEITADASRATGIPEGTPLIAAAADKACEVIGSGCLTPEVACLSYGTTATINSTRERYLEAIPLVPPYPSAVPGAWCSEIQIFRGFWMVNWFKEEFGQHERNMASKHGIEPESLFDELVSQVPPGSMGLTLQPYWSPGTRIPGPEAKGAMIGFGDVHTRAHIYRAILEGLAYALREGRERIEKRGKVPVSRLRVCGGGSQSDQAMQITADVFGLPAERPHTYETSGLGAAIDAAVGLGLHPDFETAVRRMVRVTDVFRPDPANREIYDGLYRRVYRRMYPRLKPLYHAIRDVTGYPS
ncbi:MAG TPA: FGGY-family carbohydrate kinase [Gammaproteobacteria bacterium]|nr:FGGY-family carbohydrate kinase [Gammaproteobacteria bacterium]